uniref:Uncharacterized protein n=1 Tax=Spongospora subterranea TaxID=70186 RepID=A0A0H5REL2_9EUKA|eukprot:CRZ07024.1 hypothetical protein [Spongospora subterranea]
MSTKPLVVHLSLSLTGLKRGHSSAEDLVALGESFVTSLTCVRLMSHLMKGNILRILIKLISVSLTQMMDKEMQFVESFEVILAMNFLLSSLVSIIESLMLLKIVCFSFTCETGFFSGLSSIGNRTSYCL